MCVCIVYNVCFILRLHLQYVHVPIHKIHTPTQTLCALRYFRKCVSVWVILLCCVAKGLSVFHTENKYMFLCNIYTPYGKMILYVCMYCIYIYNKYVSLYSKCIWRDVFVCVCVRKYSCKSILLVWLLGGYACACLVGVQICVREARIAILLWWSCAVRRANEYIDLHFTLIDLRVREGCVYRFIYKENCSLTHSLFIVPYTCTNICHFITHRCTGKTKWNLLQLLSGTVYWHHLCHYHSPSYTLLFF